MCQTLLDVFTGFDFGSTSVSQSLYPRRTIGLVGILEGTHCMNRRHNRQHEHDLSKELPFQYLGVFLNQLSDEAKPCTGFMSGGGNYCRNNTFDEQGTFIGLGSASSCSASNGVDASAGKDSQVQLLLSMHHCTRRGQPCSEWC